MDIIRPYYSQEKTATRPVFVIYFDPRLPSIPVIVKRHWRTMIQDPRLAEIFPLPPLVAYKRPPNIKDKLIRAKVPQASLKTQKKYPWYEKMHELCHLSICEGGEKCKINYKQLHR